MTFKKYWETRIDPYESISRSTMEDAWTAAQLAMRDRVVLGLGATIVELKTKDFPAKDFILGALLQVEESLRALQPE